MVEGKEGKGGENKDSDLGIRVRWDDSVNGDCSRKLRGGNIKVESQRHFTLRGKRGKDKLSTPSSMVPSDGAIHTRVRLM